MHKGATACADSAVLALECLVATLLDRVVPVGSSRSDMRPYRKLAAGKATAQRVPRGALCGTVLSPVERRPSAWERMRRKSKPTSGSSRWPCGRICRGRARAISDDRPLESVGMGK